ncbi:MAG: ferrochelatase [Coriobacteriales bacterium]|nr:ferrochelatase [Actinomycetes bacterium]
MRRVGVLIVGFGAPDSLEAVGPFMRELIGQTPTPAVLEEVCRRYEAIGGRSPLLDIARQLGKEVARSLAAGGVDAFVEVGMRYSDPDIAEAVRRLAESGVQQVVMVTLSPFETQVTHREYRSAFAAAAAAYPGMTVYEAPPLSQLPAFVDLFSASARRALECAAPGALLVFSAHSLPLTEADADRSYVDGLRRVADVVASASGLPAGRESRVIGGVEAYGSTHGAHPWLIAYQSQGVRGGQWLGPSVGEVIDAAAATGASGVVVVPLGFATDHLETLYDLDIVASQRAARAGLAFQRAGIPNAAPELARDVAWAVRAAIGED